MAMIIHGQDCHRSSFDITSAHTAFAGLKSIRSGRVISCGGSHVAQGEDEENLLRERRGAPCTFVTDFQYMMVGLGVPLKNVGPLAATGSPK